MKQIKHKPWCKRDECEYYKHYRCTHPNLHKDHVRLKNLYMCPILASVDECIKLN